MFTFSCVYLMLYLFIGLIFHLGVWAEDDYERTNVAYMALTVLLWPYWCLCVLLRPWRS